MNPLDRTDKRGSLVDLKKLMKKCLAVGMISPDCIDKMTEFQGLIDKAEDWKAEGNLCVKGGDYEGAKEKYTIALDVIKMSEKVRESLNVPFFLDEGTETCTLNTMNLTKAALLGNRGFMYLKLEKYFDAIRDFSNCILLCTKPQALSQQPSYTIFRYEGFAILESKAYYRRSLAFKDLGNLNQAHMDLTAIFSMEDNYLSRALPPGLEETAKKEMTHLSARNPEVKRKSLVNKKDKRLVDEKSKWVKFSTRRVVRGRQGHTAVYWEEGIYITGGQDDCHKYLNEFLKLNLKTKRWKTLNAPEDVRCRYGHTAVVYNNFMFVYGGDSSLEITCEWKYDLVNKQWTPWNKGMYEGEKSDYPYLTEHTACVLGNKMYVFGGRGKVGKKLLKHSSNFYEFDLDKDSCWCKLSGYDDENPYVQGHHYPEPRYNHSMWGDEDRKRVYVFGGCMRRPSYYCPDHQHKRETDGELEFELSNHMLTDMWYYELVTKQWVQQELRGNFPASRCEFGCTVTSQGVLIMGGFTSSLKTCVDYFPDGSPKNMYISRYMGDTFHFNSSGDYFTMVLDEDITARAKCCLVTDANDNVYALFGYNGYQNCRAHKSHCTASVFSDVSVLDLKPYTTKHCEESVKVCASCNVSGNEEKLRQCSGQCGGKVSYCSKLCQKNHWKFHKSECLKDK